MIKISDLNRLGLKGKTKNMQKDISLKIYLLHFLSNFMKVFTESLLLNLKKIECRIFFKFENKTFIKKTTYYYYFFNLKFLFLYVIKF